jgi:hypothetical protein
LTCHVSSMLMRCSVDGRLCALDVGCRRPTPSQDNGRIFARLSPGLISFFFLSLNSPSSPAALACFLSQSSRRILRNAESDVCYPSSFKSRSRLIGSFVIVTMFFRFSIRAETKEQLVSTDVTLGKDDAFASNQKRGNVKPGKCGVKLTSQGCRARPPLRCRQGASNILVLPTQSWLYPSSEGCSIVNQHAATSVSQRCYYACYTGSGSSLSLRRRYVSLSPTL